MLSDKSPSNEQIMIYFVKSENHFGEMSQKGSLLTKLHPLLKAKDQGLKHSSANSKYHFMIPISEALGGLASLHRMFSTPTVMNYLILRAYLYIM